MNPTRQPDLSADLVARQELTRLAYLRIRFQHMDVMSEVCRLSCLSDVDVVIAFSRLMDALLARDDLAEGAPGWEAALGRVEDALNLLLGEAT